MGVARVYCKGQEIIVFNTRKDCTQASQQCKYFRGCEPTVSALLVAQTFDANQKPTKLKVSEAKRAELTHILYYLLHTS